MLLPRKLIYKDRKILEELLENDFTHEVFNELVEVENLIGLCNYSKNIDTEEQYVELFNMVYYLMSEALHRPFPRLRIKEYREYIITRAKRFNLDAEVCVDVVFTIMYLASADTIDYEETFWSGLKLQISNDFFYNHLAPKPLGGYKIELSLDDLLPKPKITKVLLNSVNWYEETSEGDVQMIRYIMRYVSDSQDIRKRIGEAICEDFDFVIRGEIALRYLADNIKEIYESLGGTAPLDIPCLSPKDGDCSSQDEDTHFVSPFVIVPKKQTSVLVILETMYKANWIRKADGSKYRNRDEMINDVMRILFNHEEIKDIKQKLNSAKNRTYEGKKKYIDELMKHITEDEQVIKE